MAFLVKYPFISEINANKQNPLKSSFEALNYYMDSKASREKNRLLYRLSNITAFFYNF